MINEFQWAMIGVAATIVIAVIIYNRWQENKHRRRAERAFKGNHTDVLIDGSKQRVEPHFEPSTPLPTDVRITVDDPIDLPPVETSPLPRPGGLHPEIDTIATILANSPIEADQYHQVAEYSTTLAAKLGKPIHWEGRAASGWQPIEFDSEDPYRELRAGIQLADRSGAIGMDALQTFDHLITQFADSMAALTHREDLTITSQRATQLDAFCADTDIEIAVNLIGKNGTTFSTTKVRGLAEASGMTLLPSGEYALANELGQPLYTLRNIDSSGSPAIKQSAAGYLTGLTFALDVPRAPQPASVFERMFADVLKFADVLQGEIVDDNAKPLTANSRRLIADTISHIAKKMEEKGIAPGGPAALRLYH